MKKSIGILAVVLVAIVGGFAFAALHGEDRAGAGAQTTGDASAGSAPQITVPGNDRAASMLQTVKDRTGTQPTAGRVLHSTRGEVDKLLGLSSIGVDPVTPTDVYEFEGSFVDQAARVPKGQPQPSGKAVVMVVDANTGAVSDYGVLPSPADIATLASFGKVEQVAVN
jgi:hypothetical protein